MAYNLKHCLHYSMYGLHIIQLIIILTGCVSSKWIVYPEGSLGIFRYCTEKHDFCGLLNKDVLQEVFFINRIAMAFAILDILTVIVRLSFQLLMSMRNRKCYQSFLLISFSVVCAASTLLAVYREKPKYIFDFHRAQIGWAFYLNCSNICCDIISLLVYICTKYYLHV